MGSISRSDLLAARERIRGFVQRTPLQHSMLLSQRTGCEFWLKLENRQHTGSFKPRGALNKLLLLDGVAREKGLVAASAGNHALGVAFACHATGATPAELFVPTTASPAKLAKLRAYEARLHLVGRTYEDAHQAALEHARKNQATYLSAYDDADIVAGQGTCGLEIMEDLGDVDTVIVPVGGGALSAGIALAVKSARPRARVVGVNPAASPSALLSFRKGEALDPYDNEPTLAEGLAGGYGRVPFAIAKDLIDEIALVTEEEMKQGIAALIDSDQVLAEPSGIAAVAAALSGKVSNLSGKVVAVVSGGNIDAATLRSILN